MTQRETIDGTDERAILERTDDIAAGKLRVTGLNAEEDERIAEQERMEQKGEKKLYGSLEYVEKSAPIDTDAPLPLTVATLRFVPDEARCQYLRQMDGSFRLAFVANEDTRTRDAYLPQISDGSARLSFFDASKGTPQEQAAARTKAKDDMDKTFSTTMKKFDDEKAAEREARRKAAEEKAIAGIRRQYGYV